MGFRWNFTSATEKEWVELSCMAGFFHARQVGDLAVGKPPLHKYPKALSVGAALKALRSSDDAELSLWEELCPLTEKPIKEARELVSHVPSNHGAPSPCPPQSPNENLWRCVGKVGMVDLICFLAHDQSLADQAAALQTPVSSLVPDTAFTIQHVDPRSKCVTHLLAIIFPDFFNLFLVYHSRRAGFLGQDFQNC
jgi:hypothetical protein